MENKRWIIFIIAIVVLFGGLIAWTRITNPSLDVSGLDVNSALSASDMNGSIADHQKGTEGAKVTVIEYGDFQCPSCGAAHPYVNELLEEYGDRITFIFRNFPLTTIHPNALAASGVAEAAGLQGKYWEMHDLLFNGQSDWSSLDASNRLDVFKGYANQLGLDTAKFTDDLAGNAVSKKIKFDMAIGKQKGVSATPTFYINGTEATSSAATGLVNGSLDEFKALIDAELAK